MAAPCGRVAPLLWLVRLTTSRKRLPGRRFGFVTLPTPHPATARRRLALGSVSPSTFGTLQRGLGGSSITGMPRGGAGESLDGAGRRRIAGAWIRGRIAGLVGGGRRCRGQERAAGELGGAVGGQVGGGCGDVLLTGGWRGDERAEGRGSARRAERDRSERRLALAVAGAVARGAGEQLDAHLTAGGVIDRALNARARGHRMDARQEGERAAGRRGARCRSRSRRGRSKSIPSPGLAKISLPRIVTPVVVWPTSMPSPSMSTPSLASLWAMRLPAPATVPPTTIPLPGAGAGATGSDLKSSPRLSPSPLPSGVAPSAADADVVALDDRVGRRGPVSGHARVLVA